MPTYKVTQIYCVTADSKADALEMVHSDGAKEYLSGEFVRETEPRERRNAWGAAVRAQILGAKK